MVRHKRKSKLDIIAEKVGVSRTTVSRILARKTPLIYRPARDRAEKIWEEAQRLKYRPNVGARAMLSGRFDAVTMLLNTEDLPSNIFFGLVDGIHDALAECESHLILSKIPDPEHLENGYVPRFLREMMSDGLLINYFGQDVPETIVRDIQQFSIPSVWMNYKQAGDCVYPDDIRDADKATQYLLELGHRRIAYVDGPPGLHYSQQERRKGYERALSKADCKPIVLPTSPRELQPRFASFSKTQRPTAVLCYEAESTVPVLCAAIRCGLSIPDDLSLIQFSDKAKPLAGYDVTTMVLPWYEVGSTAARMLIQKIDRPRQRSAPKKVHSRLHEGTTCAPPRK